MPTPAKLQVVQAYDRAPIAEIDTDDAAALELKLATATQVFRDRKGWLPVHQRVDVLRRLAALMETRRDHFSRLMRAGGRQAADRRHRRNHARDRRRAQRRRRVAQLRRPRNSDGPDAREHRTAGVHDSRTDRRGGGDLRLQPPAEPDRASGGTGDCRRLSGHRQAGDGDTAVLHRVRLAGARGRPRRAVVPDIHHPGQCAGRAARNGSARRVPELHRLGALAGICTASSRPARAPRWSTAASRRRSSTAAPISMR